MVAAEMSGCEFRPQHVGGHNAGHPPARREGRPELANAVDIPVETAHRVAAGGCEDLVFVEVQTGTYFGEDDIIRLDDDYGREN
ncbi:hypothetical protein [Nocardia fusca]|uniref:hypothetical protein n=1 Tax=Nocardia fusca TaxID=941183 RepID=UPI0007A74571|nr:hypothetical protein [Nocardia fusca]